MTKRDVINALGQVIADHKTYVDIYFGKAFAEMTGRPESEVLSVLRTGLHDVPGQHMEVACSDLLRFFQDSNEFAITDMISFIAGHRLTCVYGVLVGQAFKETL